MKANHAIAGSCLCGKVRLDIDEACRDVIICHCQQCRKQTGHVLAATRVMDDKLHITGAEHIKWYDASEDAKRGFCRHCGSTLLWKPNGEDSTSVMVGCLDNPTELKTVAHIFTEFKGDYYELNDGVPAFARSD